MSNSWICNFRKSMRDYTILPAQNFTIFQKCSPWCRDSWLEFLCNLIGYSQRTNTFSKNNTSKNRYWVYDLKPDTSRNIPKTFDCIQSRYCDSFHRMFNCALQKMCPNTSRKRNLQATQSCIPRTVNVRNKMLWT